MMEPERMIRHQAVQRICWMRGAVQLANRGMVLLAALIVAVAAAATSESEALLAGMAGLIAGTLLVGAIAFNAAAKAAEPGPEERAAAAPGEDERVDIAAAAALFRARGLSPELAEEAALAAAARPIAPGEPAVRPVEGALAQATTFAAGAAVPLALASWFALDQMALGVSLGTILAASALAGLCAGKDNRPVGRTVARVMLWGGAILAASHLGGELLGALLS